jgi:type VI protein secretion system component Hcp
MEKKYLRNVPRAKGSHQEPERSGKGREISEAELDKVSGGMKTVDAASPKLFTACCTGTHYT